MKQLILLIIITLLLSGCYDYTELNDLSIISMIIIDKIDDKYLVSLEVLNDEKKEDSNKSIIVSASSDSIIESLANALAKTPKKAYLAHLKVLAISKDIAKDDLPIITDYFLRSPQIRNEFYLTIVDSNTANDLLKIQNNNINVISDYIISIFKNNKKGFNFINNNNFENIIIDIFEIGKDAIIPTIKLEKNEITKVSNALLSKYELKTILDSKETVLLNILTNKSDNILLSYKCPNSNQNISLMIYNKKTKFNIIKDNIFIKTNLMAEIEEYNCQDSLRSTKTFQEYNNYYENLLKEDLEKLYQKIRTANADSLGIGKLLYIDRRYYKKSSWLNLKPVFKTDLKINKDGLIYGVYNAN